MCPKIHIEPPVIQELLVGVVEDDGATFLNLYDGEKG